MKKNEVSDRIKTLIGDKEVLNEIREKIDFSSVSSIVDSINKSVVKNNLSNQLKNRPTLLKTIIHNESSPELSSGQLAEAIILLYGRPALLIQNDDFENPAGDVWHDRLNTYRENILGTIKSIGRIEVENHPDFEWLGTGWLIDSETIVTNRHVALEFGQASGDGFVFRTNPAGRQIKAFVDFREEYNNTSELEFKITGIRYIAENVDSVPDVAFLKVEPKNPDGILLPAGLETKTDEISEEQLVYIVGYPAKDPRNSLNEQNRIFNNIYNVKRLQPGTITSNLNESTFQHDCSTLGGDSGGPVIDMASGKVIGLHFGGSYLKSNYAVKASYINAMLSKL